MDLPEQCAGGIKMVDWIVGGTIAGACYLIPLLFGLALVVWGFWEFGKFMAKRQEIKKVKNFEEHQETKQIAKKLLQFLKNNAEKMPWSKTQELDIELPPDHERYYYLVKYFSHYQTKSKRIELKLDRRHYNYELIIRHQRIVNGKQDSTTECKIDTRQADYIDEKGKLKKDKELRQIFEGIFETVVSVYKERREAEFEGEDVDYKEKLARRKEIEKEKRIRTLQALNNNES